VKKQYVYSGVTPHSEKVAVVAIASIRVNLKISLEPQNQD